MDEISVSVIIPVYNVKSYLRKAFESVQKQNLRNIEIILVDDGSTDGSDVLCDELCQKYSNAYVIHQTNQGVSIARNVGIQNANGKYIYFLDADDYIEENTLSDNYNLAEENHADCVIFNYYREGANSDVSVGSLTLSGKYSGDELRKNFISYYTDNQPAAYFVWNKLYLREFLQEQSILFDKIPMGEDSLFNLKIYDAGNIFYFNQSIYYHYIYRLDSAVNKYDSNRFIYEFEHAKAVENLISDTMKYKFSDGKSLIESYYNRAFNFELHNIFHRDANLSFFEKVKRIKYICSMEEINKYVINGTLYGLSRNDRLKIFLVRRKLHGILIFLVWMMDELMNIKK